MTITDITTGDGSAIAIAHGMIATRCTVAIAVLLLLFLCLTLFDYFIGS